MSRVLIPNVQTVAIKAIGKESNIARVLVTTAEHGKQFHSFTLKAYDSLIKLTADIQGEYTLELLQYSEKDSTLITDVTVIK